MTALGWQDTAQAGAAASHPPAHTAEIEQLKRTRR
jgi:hypothetical protein